MGKKETISFLNGIRGIACVIVFLGHYNSDFGGLPGLDQTLFRSYFLKACGINGNFAVNLFFIVSSFIVADYIEKNEKIEDLPRKMIGRYLRLAVPLLFVYECIYVLNKCHLFYNLQAALLLSNSELANYFQGDYSQLKVVWEALFGTLFFGNCSFNGMMWMMQIMFLGWYVAVGISLCLKWSGFNVKLYIVIIVMGMALLINNSYYSCIVAGVIIRYLSKYIKENDLFIYKFISLIIGILGLVIVRYCFELSNIIGKKSGYVPLNSWYFYCKVGAILVMIGVCRCLWLSRLFSGRFLMFFNDISFPIFLFHRLVESTVGAYVIVHVNSQNVDVVAWLCTITSLVLISIIYAKIIDRSFGKLTGFILDSIFRFSKHTS